VAVSVIRINAITVPAQGGEELARRFASRAGAVDNAPGFEGFELLRPTDGRDTWLVVTRWADEDSFQAWVKSPAFAHGHRGVAPAGAHGHGGSGHVAVASELWSYEVVDLKAAAEGGGE
jgi:heme-degrading monooxygenase HmoA